MLGSNILAGSSGQAGEKSGYQIEKSLRFNPADTPDLTLTPSSSGNSQKFTISFWHKKCSNGAIRMLLHTGTNYSNLFRVQISAADKLTVHHYNGSSYTFDYTSTRVFKDIGAWYHFVLAFDTTQATASDRFKAYVNGVQITEWDSSNAPSQNLSIAWNSTIHQRIGRENTTTYGTYYSVDGYLAEFINIDGQQLAATDFGEFDDNNVWQPKAYTGTYGTNGFHLNFADNSSVGTLGTDSSGNGNNWTPNNFSITSQNIAAYTGYSGSNWAVALSNMFDGNLTTYSYPNANTTGTVNFSPAITGSSIRIRMGASIATTGFTVNGSSVSGVSGAGDRWIDVTSHTSGSLTQITCGYVPGQYSSYVYAIEADGVIVGPAQNTTSDSLTDTPTNYGSDTGAGGEVGGNYCTWNSLNNLANANILNGNLQANSTQTNFQGVVGTIFASSGKWYAEFQPSTGTDQVVGIAGPTFEGSISDNRYIGKTNDSYALYSNGQIINNNNFFAYGTSWSANDIIGIALDLDNGKVFFSRNGVWQGSGNPATGSNPAFLRLTGEFTFAASPYGSGEGIVANFGQRAWAHTPPSGYKALCTQNLPDPPVEDPSKHFDTILWTGQGNTNDRTLTTTCSADLVWTKARNYAYSLPIWDTVRGYGHKELRTNSSGTEGTVNGANFKSSTDTSITFEASSNGDNSYYNGGGHNYVGWLWNAGSSNTSVAAGDLNTLSYDQSRVWSNAWSGTVGYGSFANLHDANFSNYLQASATLTINPSINSNKIRLYCNNHSATGSHYIKINGVDVTNQLVVGNYAWNEITGITAPITSIEQYSANYSSNLVTLRAIEIDGKVLVDQGVTPADVPSIATTYRANPTAGFSIVSYTATNTAGTVAHGLNSIPEFIIVKNRDSAYNWTVYHKDSGAANALYLNLANAPSASSAQWNDLAPSSQAFNIGAGGNTNYASGDNIIAYCFTGVDGYSKFGTYTGNATADPNGLFVYLGFRPAFLLIKSNAGWWNILDTGRDEYNPGKSLLFANDSGAEYSGSPDRVLFLSNGFKMLSGTSDPNSAVTHYYAAFAEHPFKTTRAL